jgi:hypothetical protein
MRCGRDRPFCRHRHTRCWAITISKSVTLIDLAVRAACRHGAQVIEGRTVALNGFRLAGLGGRCAGMDDPAFLDALAPNTPGLAPAHNPDSAERLRPTPHLPVLAGHTHSGQMRGLFPWPRPAGAPWLRPWRTRA